jgi:hypothetical protein
MSSLPKPLGQLWILHIHYYFSTDPTFFGRAGKIDTHVLEFYSYRLRARGSVDRASGSGPEDRGFESLRAHS